MTAGIFQLILLVFFLPLMGHGGIVPAQAKALPRKILVLYDSRQTDGAHWTTVHQLAEMPLNHLGLVVTYRDINEGLPAIDQLEDVRGVLTWSQSDKMGNPLKFLEWARAVIDAGKRFVIIGDLPANRDLNHRLTPLQAINRFLAKLGLQMQRDWREITYNVKVVRKVSYMVEFEHPLPTRLPPFERMKQIDPRAKSYLVVRSGDDPQSDTSLVVINPHGGYVASGYTHYSDPDLDQRQWYLNPFEFFRLAFATDDLPKPDTTTLLGKRVFYSHIDGDGWRNITEIMPYKKRFVAAAEVVLKEILEVFPDLPVTVSPVAGDLDPTWHGNKESLNLAKKIFALPHVEAGSHTYSHPFYWAFFADGHPAKEEQYLSFYPGRRSLLKKLFSLNLFGRRNAVFTRLPKQPTTTASARAAHQSRSHSLQEKDIHLPNDYHTPRAYAIEPFDLKKEIQGSLDFINALLPPGKRAEVLQWSGNTMPFEEAVAAAREAGVRNINGGDARFDPEFPSYSWVAPLGREVGSERQIYASNSNENTYTDLWTRRFFGFKHLVTTLQNTESPIRIKPLNVYYHMFSGEKLASLNAVLQNLRYARSQEIIPITTSRFASIVDGFFTCRISAIGNQQWRIEKRDALQTIRFDHATFQSVDFARSQGVIGQHHYQGSLYVALDAAHGSPVVALKDHPWSDQSPKAARPYLIQSRWRIWALQLNGDGFSFSTQGFGTGEMKWKVPTSGQYKVQLTEETGEQHRLKVMASKDGLLHLTLGSWAVKPARIDITLAKRSP
ncbi:MAG: hypothetical protein ACE5JU_01745 [Candidatus Binatia bacterium]